MPACICTWEIYLCRRAGWLLAGGVTLGELEQYFRELAVIRHQVAEECGQWVLS